jgi:hypothetical protein
VLEHHHHTVVLADTVEQALEVMVDTMTWSSSCCCSRCGYIQIAIQKSKQPFLFLFILDTSKKKVQEL